jgi:hypothetical protein
MRLRKRATAEAQTLAGICKLEQINMKSHSTKWTLVFLLAGVFSNCRKAEPEIKIDFWGKWKTQKIVLLNTATNITIETTTNYDQCLLDDIFEFMSKNRFNAYENGIECNFGTKSYDNIIEITRDNKDKIVAFQILPVIDELYHPIIETNDFFLVNILDIDNIEISNLTRCSPEQVICKRTITLKRL